MGRRSAQLRLADVDREMRSAFCLSNRSELTRRRLPERRAVRSQAAKKFLDSPKHIWYRPSHDAGVIVSLRARRAATEGAAALRAKVHNPDWSWRKNLEAASERENLRLCSPMFAYVRLMGEKIERHALDRRDHGAGAPEFWRTYVLRRLEKQSATKWKRRLSACFSCFSFPVALVAWFFGRITWPLEGGRESFTLMGATDARFVPPDRGDFVLAFAKATGKGGHVLLTQLGTSGERLRPEVSHGV